MRHLAVDSVIEQFALGFREQTGHDPLPWQTRLFERFLDSDLPEALDLPTGLGKTAVMAIWALALAEGARLPRRLFYVVDRRAVVDQASAVASKIAEQLTLPSHGVDGANLLAVSTLRGGAKDNRLWMLDPSRPAIVVGTVDMIGSRLLFEGYGVSRRMRPFHAALTGVDSLVVLDEAHLAAPFQKLLEAIAGEQRHLGLWPADGCTGLPARIRVLSLSATLASGATGRFELEGEDYAHPLVSQRLHAFKRLTILNPEGDESLEGALVQHALALGSSDSGPRRVLVFVNSRDVAGKVASALRTSLEAALRPSIGAQARPVAADRVCLLVGARRVHERGKVEVWLKDKTFQSDPERPEPSCPVFLVATSAGEVGVDLDADHLVCDLVEWERMVQRFGRLNRLGLRGDSQAIVVAAETAPDAKLQAILDRPESQRSDKDRKALKAFEQKTAAERARRAVLNALPADEAGPVMVNPATLKNVAGTAAALAATTPPTLRPPLTKALVEAWAMTSLKDHTGRPEVAPWLRGWVGDEPQTKVVWRAVLPVDDKGRALPDGDLQRFFEAAPIDREEELETETSSVFKWLKALKVAPSAHDSPAREAVEAASDAAGAMEVEKDLPLAAPLKAGAVSGFLLDGAGELIQSGSIKLGQSGKDGELTVEIPAAMERRLPGAVLVLDRRLAGLSKDGLLDAKERNSPATADDGESFGARRTLKIHTTASPPDAPGQLVLDAGWTPNGEPQRWISILGGLGEEERSFAPGCAQTLSEHQSWALEEAEAITRRLGLPGSLAALIHLAARLHDEGKRAAIWQRAMAGRVDGEPLAKTKSAANPRLLGGYRHEFGSLPHVRHDAEFAALSQHDQELVLHLVAAHHGYARPLIRHHGGAEAPSVLEQQAAEVALRYLRLQQRFGPWGLAWLEALVRAADALASARLAAGAPEGLDHG
jgi:CRISPR-associated endonuclease/helicase Cas3